MSSVEGILDILDPRGQALIKAKSLNKNIMSLPEVPNTGSTFKDFLLQIMGTAPNAAGFRAPPGPRITGGGGPALRITKEPPFEATLINRHNPESAMDLSLQPGMRKADMGVPQVSGAGIAENSNVFNPRANQVLNYLSNRELSIHRAYDSPGGTSYISSTNPTNKDPIMVRIPKEGEGHDSSSLRTKRFVDQNGPASFYDVTDSKGGKKGGGWQTSSVKKNESGEFYGKDKSLQSLFDAIDHATGKKLVPEGRAPNYSNPNKKGITEEPPPPLEKPLNMDDLIDSTLKDMEKPTAQNLERMNYTNDSPNRNIQREVGEPANFNKSEGQLLTEERLEYAKEFQQRHGLSLEEYRRIKEQQWKHSETVEDFNQKIGQAREAGNTQEINRLNALKSQYFKQNEKRMTKDYDALPENVQEMIDNDLRSRHERITRETFMKALREKIDEVVAEQKKNMEQPKFTPKQMIDMTKAMSPKELPDLSLLKPANN